MPAQAFSQSTLTSRIFSYMKSRFLEGKCVGRSISRVLSWTVIPLGSPSPTTSSSLPGSGAGRAIGPLFGLAPGGVFRAAPVAGSAVRSYRTFSPLPDPLRAIGGSFSVALSVAAPETDAAPRRYLAPCPLEPGLSSPTANERSGGDCLTDPHERILAQPASTQPSAAPSSSNCWYNARRDLPSSCAATFAARVAGNSAASARSRACSSSAATHRAPSCTPSTSSTISPRCWSGSAATNASSCASEPRRTVSKVFVNSRASAPARWPPNTSTNEVSVSSTRCGAS